jgi:hypothetical protein
MNAALALPTLVSVAGLWIFLSWAYRDYRVEFFRQRLFAIRDELFDLARSGKISFDNPAYGALRTLMNGFIRFGERVSVPWFIALAIAIDGKTRAELPNEFQERWEHGLRELEPETQQRLNVLRSQIEETVLNQAFLASPLVLTLSVTVLLPVMLVAFVAMHATQRVKGQLVSWFEPSAFAAAYNEGALKA